MTHRPLRGALALLLAGAALPAQTPHHAERGPRAPRRPTTSCVIARITDGDTIVCRSGERVRLIGMDAPERSQRPFGAQATQALTRLIPPGDTVALEPDVDARDRYGRLLAYVWRDGTLINWVMVRRGWALLLTMPPDVQYVDWFIRAEQRARADSLGLWASGGFACPPRAHRRGLCR